MLDKIVISYAVLTVCHAGYHHYGPAVPSHNIIHHDHVAHHSHDHVAHQPDLYAAPTHHEAEAEDHGHDHYIGQFAYPKYGYEYSVEDPHTGDHKSHHETRDGDVVKGEYSLLQPDGSFRKVTYTADPHNGFNAIVHNTPPVHHH